MVKMKNIFNGLKIVLFIFSFTLFELNAQTTEKKAEIYQNQQRAYHLTVFNNEIKSVDDAPMRCFLRFQIAKFIFEKKVLDYYETATSLAFDCLDDSVKNSNQFTNSQSAFWKSNIISLLRLNDPEEAIKAEQKYLADENTDYADLNEIGTAKDLSAVTNRIISKIKKGEVSDEIFPVFLKLNEKSQNLSAFLLEALLGFFESTPELNKYGATLNFLSNYYLKETISINLRRRFLEFTVKLSQKVLSEPDNSVLFQHSRFILEISLPSIKELIPSLYPQALLIYSTLNGKISNFNREKEEIYKRIELSENKLQQTVAEAENTEIKSLKNDLLLDASRLALKEKKYQLATELILKIEKDEQTFQSWRAQFLVDDVLNGALIDEDFEVSEFIVKRVENLNERSRGILKIASQYNKLNNKIQALEKVNDALKILEKVENNSAKARIMLSAVPIAVKIDKANAFDITTSAIKTINRLPTPSVDDKLGTEARKKYVDAVLLPTSFNLVQAFKLLFREDFDVTYSNIQEIEIKGWKLAMQIMAETERKHEYLPERNNIKKKQKP